MMEFERIADTKRSSFITRAVAESVRAGGRILDVGCGNGIISRALGSLGYDVTGIDVSEKTIAVATKENDLPNVRFRVVSPGKLIEKTMPFDAIICSEVLEHLHEPAQLLDLIYKSLTETGILIVTVPNGRGPRELLVTRPVQAMQKNNGFAWRILAAIKNKMGYAGETVQSSADDLRHIQFFTKRSLIALANSSGFKISRISAGNFIEQVFPFSLITKRSRALQRLDCRMADLLPLSFSSGFMSVWRKKSEA